MARPDQPGRGGFTGRSGRTAGAARRARAVALVRSVIDRQAAVRIEELQVRGVDGEPLGRVAGSKGRRGRRAGPRGENRRPSRCARHLGLRGMASPHVLAEEIVQDCRYSIGLTTVVWGGVARTGYHHSACAGENAGQAVERGSEVAGAPGTAEQKDLTGQHPESLQRPGRTVDRLSVVAQGWDQFAGGHDAGGCRPAGRPLDGEVQGGSQGSPRDPANQGGPVRGGLEHRDECGPWLPSIELPLVAGSPFTVNDTVEAKRRLVECESGNIRPAKSRFNRDDRS